MLLFNPLIQESLQRNNFDQLLNQLNGAVWLPISNSLWRTVRDEGLDNERNCSDRTQWQFIKLNIPNEHKDLLKRFNDDIVNWYADFDYELKDKFHGKYVDLIDYDRGVIHIVTCKAILEEVNNLENSIWYHCTNEENALKIMKEGFKFSNRFLQIFFAQPADKYYGSYCIEVDLQNLKLVDLLELQKVTSLWYAEKDQPHFILYLKKNGIDGYWYGTNSTPTIPAQCLVFSLDKLNQCPRTLKVFQA